jgi:hypothetical protein
MAWQKIEERGHGKKALSGHGKNGGKSAWHDKKWWDASMAKIGEEGMAKNCRKRAWQKRREKNKLIRLHTVH